MAGNSKAKKSKRTGVKNPVISNRRASYDYALDDELTVGLVLGGKDVRAARSGRVQLKGSFITVRNNELWLNNASFSLLLNSKGINETTVDTSPRKLLAHKKQIAQLEEKKSAGFSIVPLRMYTSGRHIKLVIAVGKGKKNYDKRQAIKKRDQQRDAAKMVY